jgi:hypothetical protein
MFVFDEGLAFVVLLCTTVVLLTKKVIFDHYEQLQKMMLPMRIWYSASTFRTYARCDKVTGLVACDIDRSFGSISLSTRMYPLTDRMAWKKQPGCRGL